MSLFAAGVALLVLFIASYSRRSIWIALGSTAMSMAALLGCLLLATAHDPDQVRTRFAWIANQLPPALGGQISEDLTTAVQHVWTPSSCGAGERPGCARPTGAESDSGRHEAMQAAATASWLGSEPESKPMSDSPVSWLLDDPHGQASSKGSEGFSLSGTNVSDQALEEVHAVLKPDSSQRELELVLNVAGHKLKDGALIPAGARFSLASEAPNASKQIGGAILSFRYIQAGQRKSSILYLTPSMIARLANRS